MTNPNLKQFARVRVSFDGVVTKAHGDGSVSLDILDSRSIGMYFTQREIPHLRVEVLDDVMVRETARVKAMMAPAQPAPTPPAASTAPDLLRRAAEIMDERGRQYDRPNGERAMVATVKAFNTIVGRAALSEVEGWMLLLVLKLVRARQNTATAHEDSYIDAVAYASLAAEAALKPEAA